MIPISDHIISGLTKTYRPWVIASWAPFAFLGVEVNRLSSNSANLPYHRRRSLSVDSITTKEPLSLLSLNHGPADETVSSTGELSGIYFGILNIYTTLPQFVGTFISMIVFGILEPGKSPELAHDSPAHEHHGTDGPNAIAVCLVIGAFSMLCAAHVTRKLKLLK